MFFFFYTPPSERGEDLVLHFGGQHAEINAQTFSNSLLAITAAIEEINRQINPGFAIEVSIDALAEGSFRAFLKTKKISLSGLAVEIVKDTVIGILVALIVQKTTSEPIQVIIGDEKITVTQGEEMLILPQDARKSGTPAGEDPREMLMDPAEVDRHISRSFEYLGRDSAITEFGIARGLDAAPLFLVPAVDFSRMAVPLSDNPDQEITRFKDEEARLVILKAVFKRGNRKWEFVWNGIPISAPITDESFFDKMASREFVFAQGDVLSATLRIYQTKDEMTGVYINTGYEVIEVHGLNKRPEQTTFLR